LRSATASRVGSAAMKAGVASLMVFGDLPDLASPSAVPAHTRIEQWLTQVIGRGELVPGDRLPPEDQLAARLGVSRMTLRQALASLGVLGTIVRKPGRLGGTFVAEPRIECDLTGLAGFTEQMKRANLRAGARIVSLATLPASRSVAAGLSVERGAPVHEIVRVRTANREPLALERAYFPAASFPDLLDHRLTGSIYRLLSRHYDQSPHTAIETLEPVAAGAQEAALLRITAGTPVMLIERTAFTAAGLAVEFARDLFRSDRVRISLRTGISRASS
jgi:GntR family transcriptional regulator